MPRSRYCGGSGRRSMSRTRIIESPDPSATRKFDEFLIETRDIDGDELFVKELVCACATGMGGGARAGDGDAHFLGFALHGAGEIERLLGLEHCGAGQLELLQLSPVLGHARDFGLVGQQRGARGGLGCLQPAPILESGKHEQHADHDHDEGDGQHHEPSFLGPEVQLVEEAGHRIKDRCGGFRTRCSSSWGALPRRRRPGCCGSRPG